MAGAEIAATINMSQSEPISEVPASTADALGSVQTNQENLGTSLARTVLTEEQIAQDNRPEVLLMKPPTGLFYTDSYFDFIIALNCHRSNKLK